MVKQFEKLSRKEKEILFSIPVLVSVLAASDDNGVDEEQKADAIKLAHLKTFTANPQLISYYQKVEEHFKENFEMTVKKYLPFTSDSRDLLKLEISQANKVLSKLKKDFAVLLNQSWNDYGKHVRRSKHNFLEDFIFPLPIHGITDI